MKTKEQILAWLDKQPWKDEFYKAIFLHGNPKNLDADADSFLKNCSFTGLNLDENK